MSIMKVDNTFPCESHLISKQDITYKLCVYNTSCKKPLAKHYPSTIVRMCEGLYSLDMLWLNDFMENSPDKAWDGRMTDE
jgi:hypothetical protein